MSNPGGVAETKIRRPSGLVYGLKTHNADRARAGARHGGMHPEEGGDSCMGTVKRSLAVGGLLVFLIHFLRTTETTV